jgi:hypothetical protein
VIFTKTDVTRKPSLARGPDAYILRVSFPLLDNNKNEIQTPKQYCNHSDLAGETNRKGELRKVGNIDHREVRRVRLLPCRNSKRFKHIRNDISTTNCEYRSNRMTVRDTVLLKERTRARLCL